MQTELTPKQQASELIKQAQNVLIVTGREPNDDQLSAAIAMQRVLNKLQKQASVVITDRLPKSSALYDMQFVSKDLSGVRDFIISVDMHSVVVDKLKYNVENDKLKVTVTPLNGNFSSRDVSFEQGPYKFDLVVVLGIASIGKIDKVVEQNPTIFDGLHLINIDYHRINEGFGSVNYIDQNSSSVCEMLVSLFESLEQGIVDESIATALFTGITSATHNFTTPDTTAKAMTIAAQMLSAGAKQQQIVKVMRGRQDYNRPAHPAQSVKPEASQAPDVAKATSMKEAMEQAKAEIADKMDVSGKDGFDTQKTTNTQDGRGSEPEQGSKKKTQAKPGPVMDESGQKANSETRTSRPDHSKDDLAQVLPKDLINSPESPLDNIEPSKE